MPLKEVGQDCETYFFTVYRLQHCHLNNYIQEKLGLCLKYNKLYMTNVLINLSKAIIVLKLYHCTKQSNRYFNNTTAAIITDV